MSNMSYCRFENTYQDLRDCLTAVEEISNKRLSKTENQYAHRMFELFLGVCQDYGIITDYDVHVLNDVLDATELEEDED